ncbi:MAG TPA: MG2 domain-containing protein, partial [Chitinophagaceae bacterium]|nr:MG2 domain-containing protein [Chitinophagaceae bacterium]
KLFITGRNGLTDEHDESYIPKERAAYEEHYRTTYFFTDRSIYRPGQVVYFKAITMTTDFKTKRSKLVTGKKLKIFLKDANNEVADSVSVVTNQFGSIAGRFTIPVNKLNGTFSLDEEKGEANFRVEEYKRPKFSVACDPVSGSYRLGDSITITGVAKSFAGNSIDGATVKYSVTRRSEFRNLDWYWERAYGSRRKYEITHGETITRADGTFSISFKALPDQKIKKDLQPYFIYEITADVTDINGETRSAEAYVKASYKALNLEVKLPGENLHPGELSGINIRTTNMAGQFQQSLVNVAIHRLAVPARIIRKRYWEQPDLHLFSKEEYLKYFPYDEYSDESSKTAWERLDKVYDRSDSTMANGQFYIDGNKFPVGWYVIEVSAQDKYGETVKTIEYFELRGNDNGPVKPQYDWNLVNNTEALPGDTATIITGSSTDVYLIQCIDRGNEKYQYNFSQLNNARKTLRIPVRESDRGGIKFMQAFV